MNGVYSVKTGEHSQHGQTRQAWRMGCCDLTGLMCFTSTTKHLLEVACQHPANGVCAIQDRLSLRRGSVKPIPLPSAEFIRLHYYRLQLSEGVISHYNIAIRHNTVAQRI